MRLVFELYLPYTPEIRSRMVGFYVLCEVMMREYIQIIPGIIGALGFIVYFGMPFFPRIRSRYREWAFRRLAAKAGHDVSKYKIDISRLPLMKGICISKYFIKLQ